MISELVSGEARVRNYRPSSCQGTSRTEHSAWLQGYGGSRV